MTNGRRDMSKPNEPPPNDYLNANNSEIFINYEQAETE